MEGKKKEMQKPFGKIALAFSIVLAVVLLIVGTGASLAWFQDSSADVNNVFHRADFDLVVSHRLDNGTYEEVDQTTKVFSDEALYEPGYTQVVYLKVENKGTLPFKYKTAVSITDFTPGTNVFGQSFNLQDYLIFGIVSADTEAALEALIDTREKAKTYANTPLGSYTTEEKTLAAGAETYMAIVVRMPEDIGNIANYRGSVVPMVKMGIIVTAEQVH